MISRKGLIRKADSKFSKWVRERGSRQGCNQCVTCGRWLPISDLDSGHYVSREYHSLCYDERNVWPQCKSCNRFKEGRKDQFALFLIRKFGPHILEELDQERKKVKQWSEKDLIKLI